jgi:ribosomal protein S18 acetylase RimI-like enzyme
MDLATPSLALRPAWRGDADAVAQLILEPTPSLRDLLGSAATAHRVARASFRSPRTLHSHRRAVVATDGAWIFGVVIAAAGAEWRHRRAWTGLVMLRAGITRARALLRSGALLDRLTRPVPADSVYVASLAVAPGARGRGVGSALMAQVEAEARRRGAARLALDVRQANAGGRAFYARLGFVEADPTTVTGFLRLEKLLSPTAAAA